jgi:hypothetical protein
MVLIASLKRSAIRRGTYVYLLTSFTKSLQIEETENRINGNSLA